MARTKQPAQPKPCVWVDEGECWETACEEAFMFNVDGPRENHFRFCPYCGRPIAARACRGAKEA